MNYSGLIIADIYKLHGCGIEEIHYPDKKQ